MFGVDLGQKSAKKLFGNDLLLKIFILAKIGKKIFPEKCDFFCFFLMFKIDLGQKSAKKLFENGF